MLTRYRMGVLSAGVPEAVAHAGGLLCDRSLIGWDVVVFAADTGHDTALRILGAARADGMPEDPAEQPLLRAVAVSGDLYRTNPDVRRWVEAAMREPRIEVLVWDTRRPDGRHVEIPVSRAAAVFLEHALTVTGREAAPRASEFYRQLRTGGIRRSSPRHTIFTTVNGV